MPTNTMNISLPESLKAFVDQRVAERGYGSHSEYVRDLVRRDELEAAKEQMRALITAGLHSEPGKDWNTLRDELLQRASRRKK